MLERRFLDSVKRIIEAGSGQVIGVDALAAQTNDGVTHFLVDAPRYRELSRDILEKLQTKDVHCCKSVYVCKYLCCVYTFSLLTKPTGV